MKTLVLGLVVTGVVFMAPRAANAQQTHPDISGRWVFDSAKSDRPISPEERSPMPIERRPPVDSEGGERGGYGRPGEMGGTGEMGEGGGYRRGRSTPSEKDRARMRVMMRLAQPDSAISISLTDSTVTIVMPNDSMTLNLDGRKLKDTVGANVELESKAEWKDDALVVERDFGSGYKITERYTLSGTKRYLWLYVQANRGNFHMPTPFLRVYYHPGEEP